MDRKSIIIIVVCMGLLLAWQKMALHYFPVPPGLTNQVSVATGPAGGAGAGGQQPFQPGAAPAFGGGGQASGFVVSTNVPEQTVVLENADVRYEFTSRGGGIKTIQLKRYPESVAGRNAAESAKTNLASLNTAVAPPVLAVMGDGVDTLQGDGAFTLTQTKDGVRAEKTLPDGLAIVKQFQLDTNYLLSASVRLENRSGAAITLPAQRWVVGTAIPMNSQDNAARMRTLGVWWDDGASKGPQTVYSSYFDTNTTVLFVFHRTVRSEYHGGNSNVVWVSAQNRFFSLATMPKTPATALEVHAVDLPPPSQEEIDANPRNVNTAPIGLEAALDYAGGTLAPGAFIQRDFNLFTGPKEYHTLAEVADRFTNNIDWVMGFNGFWGWFARQLLTVMELLHNALRLPYGWAIVATTVLLKLLFWPLTQYSAKSMKRMQALQPQVKALQEKYKDDPAKFTQKQMELWKKNKVSPLSGCLPMLVQLPFLGGFYRMLQSAIELRGAGFLWISDLSKPDTLFVLPGFEIPVNPMPLLMGATMLWQSHMAPPSPGMDPAQQKMMRYMPLFFLLIMYRYPAGLALYWTVQNLLSILQTKLIQTTATATAAAPAAAVAPQKKKK
jgi:YidC/Oxa1 family membrane protein insertase